MRSRNLMPYSADTLADGLDCFGKHLFSAVVLDLGLPDSDPMMTAHRIPEFSPVGVIVLTGDDDRALIREARRHGADYCIKPVDANLLIEKVLQSIEYREPSREVEEAILDVQRANPLEGEKPWVLKWAPAITISISLLIMSGVVGSFLFTKIYDTAAETKGNRIHFDTLDKAIVQIQANMDETAKTSMDLRQRAQRSEDDRAGLHREIANAADVQRDARKEILDRLNRIEDKLDRKLP